MSSELVRRPPKRGVPTKPPRGRSLCAKQGKRRYRSAGQAKRAGAEFSQRYESTYRVYQCYACKGWHLTTSTGRWTGPKETDLGDVALTVLRRPVPGHRWPYGPPEDHESCCRLFEAGLFCDCKLSAADEEEACPCELLPLPCSTCAGVK